MQLRAMCNQHLKELMNQTRSAHARAVELKNRIFVGQHKKLCSKKVHGASKDILWSSIFLGWVYIPDKMKQVIDSAQVLIKR